jgi:hypothetical protein
MKIKTGWTHLTPNDIIRHADLTDTPCECGAGIRRVTISVYACPETIKRSELNAFMGNRRWQTQEQDGQIVAIREADCCPWTEVTEG